MMVCAIHVNAGKAHRLRMSTLNDQINKPTNVYTAKRKLMICIRSWKLSVTIMITSMFTKLY